MKKEQVLEILDALNDRTHQMANDEWNTYAAGIHYAIGWITQSLTHIEEEEDK